MFEVPDWETDIPETNILFTEKPKNKRSKNGVVEATPILSVEGNHQDEQFLGNNIFSFGSNNNASHKKKKPKPSKQSKARSNEIKNEDIFKKEAEGFEMDEILVNAKKKKLNDIYMKEDCEELLFDDTEQTKLVVTNSPKAAKLKSDLTNGIIASNTNKSPKKRKQIIDTNKEVSNIIVSAKKIKLNDNETVTKNKMKNSQKDETDKVNKLNVKKNKPIDANATEVLNKKDNSRKEKITKLFELSHRRSINTTGNKLRERMLQKLKAAQFRYLNEKLYTSSGDEAQQLFQSDPVAFRTYHQGYQLQVKKWPVNPLDVIVKKIQKMPKSFVIADMGCGEAALSKRVPHKVHSFDLVSSAPGVVACDMARTPLLKGSTDVVVYCLALMGTELTKYLVEANRILKTGGHLLIAEVESRFDDVNTFARDVERLGFRLKELDRQREVFFFLQFAKNQEPPVKKAKLPVLNLKPCLYKRR